MLLRPYSYEIEAKEYPGQIFERTNYTNGNKYCGETYNGQRHGYGIHIWENGFETVLVLAGRTGSAFSLQI